MKNAVKRPGKSGLRGLQKSILVICQELFEEDFDMFFRKKGNFNRPSVYLT